MLFYLIIFTVKYLNFLKENVNVLAKTKTNEDHKILVRLD